MVCRDYIVYSFLSVTPSTKSTKFGSRYLVEGFSEWDEIWQVDRRGLDVHQDQDGAKVLKGVKKFCKAFLIHHSADSSEIWNDEGHLCIAGLLLFC